MKCRFVTYLLIATSMCPVSAEWQKHTIMELGRNTTAVAADYDGDGDVDVITSYDGKVSLFLAPEWKEVEIHRLPNNRGQCIHSESLDIDGDGDEDWVGSQANVAPFWLENPGKDDMPWKARIIDYDIRGIHCILKADVDRDGKDDVIINNFTPEGPLGDSVVWLSIPEDVKSASHWDRHVFAEKDAGGGSHYFGFGDVDGDGWGEIAVAAKGAPFEGGDWFAYWKNPGEKGIESPWQKVVLAEGQLGATNILPGDVNGDGKTDYLASRGHGAGVVWFEAPDWKEHEMDPGMKSPHSLVLVDLDGDGDLDGASCGFESERVSVYFNDGEGVFTRLDIDDAQESYDLRAVDMDGDGDLDLLNAGRNSKNVVWYENPLR
ncbi:MAG: VCBS repeat-containing protein [Luteolibacter sp.]